MAGGTGWALRTSQGISWPSLYMRRIWSCDVSLSTCKHPTQPLPLSVLPMNLILGRQTSRNAHGANEDSLSTVPQRHLGLASNSEELAEVQKVVRVLPERPAVRCRNSAVRRGAREPLAVGYRGLWGPAARHGSL